MAAASGAAAANGGIVGLWKRAFPVLTVIGGVRAGLRSHDVRVAYYDETDRDAYNKRRPLLVSERMMAAMLGAVTYPYLLPMVIWNDIGRLEIALRGLDPKKYGCEKHSVLETLF